MTLISSLTPPETPLKPLTIAIVGAGVRGQLYASYATLFPQWLKVVAVCDQYDYNCQRMAEEHKIPAENVFVGHWSKIATQPKLADAVAICTPDHAHVGPAIAFADLKYHMLLEKPMGVTVEECIAIEKAVTRNKITFAAGYVTRYTEYMQTIKRVIESNVLGEIINIQHLIPVGFWRFAHSYVRGNWHNDSESMFSLLGKCCHDFVIVAYLMNKKCINLSSFGSLAQFKKEKKPKEAGNVINCLDCDYEASCPYSAKKIYIDELLIKENENQGPIRVFQPKGDIDIENLTEALRIGNYGRCVYEMDNDVCDQQVVNMEFENGTTASLSFVGCAENSLRKTRIFGTRGELTGDAYDRISVYNFMTREKTVITPSESGLDHLVSHGLAGGCSGGGELIQAFVYACVSGDKRYIFSNANETLDSHTYVFAAEHARKSGTVVNIDEYMKPFLQE